MEVLSEIVDFLLEKVPVRIFLAVCSEIGSRNGSRISFQNYFETMGRNPSTTALGVALEFITTDPLELPPKLSLGNLAKV